MKYKYQIAPLALPIAVVNGDANFLRKKKNATHFFSIEIANKHRIPSRHHRMRNNIQNSSMSKPISPSFKDSEAVVFGLSGPTILRAGQAKQDGPLSLSHPPSHGRKGSPTSIPVRRFRSVDFTEMAGTLALSGGCCVTSRTNQQLRSSFSTSKQQSTRKRWNTNQVSGNATGLVHFGPATMGATGLRLMQLAKGPCQGDYLGSLLHGIWILEDRYS